VLFLSNSTGKIWSYSQGFQLHLIRLPSGEDLLNLPISIREDEGDVKIFNPLIELFAELTLAYKIFLSRGNSPGVFISSWVISKLNRNFFLQTSFRMLSSEHLSFFLA